MNARGPKLGSYVPLMSFNKLISGIFEKKIFDFYGRKCAKNCKECYIFVHKNEKNKNP